MAEVVANMSMSLDGYINDVDGGVERLFGWYAASQETVRMPGDEREFTMSPASAEHQHKAVAGVGALVCGRRLFDLAKGWGGRHPVGVPVFVVTHEPPMPWGHPEAPFTFVTDGVASAVAQARAVAGARTVAVGSADITGQCLDLGLLDAVAVDLVPVLLGAGTPFFGGLTQAPVALEKPTVVQGDGVTHLHYRVRR